MADELTFYDWLRPVTGYKNVYQGVIRIDPWSPSTGPFSGGGTYDYPVVTRDDTNVYFLYRDGTGRPWIEIYPPGGGVKYLTSDDFDNPSHWGVPGVDRLVRYEDGGGLDSGPIPGAWRSNEEGEEPLGRVESHVEESPPLEETTPLFGPQEAPAPEPDYDPWDQPREGHWDPAALRWVPDEPTSSIGKVLDDDTPWNQPREGEPTTMRSAGILGHGHMGTRGESRPAADEDSSAADHKADLGDEVAGPLRSGGHWDPAALRWVPDEPTSSDVGTAGGRLGKWLDDSTLPEEVEGDPNAGEPGPSQEIIYPEPPPGPWDQPREGQPTTMDSAGILDDDSEDTQVPVDEGGGAGESLDPSSPAPEGGGGAAGIGVPYQDYIPFFPMLQDPATGEWRNAEPGEIPGSEGSEPADASGSPQALSHLFDPSTPGPTVDADLFNPNAPGPTLDPRLLLDSDSSSGPT